MQHLLQKPDLKPHWLRVKAFSGNGYAATAASIKKHKLNTICEDAACPNRGECWNDNHAAFMILGKICSRSCSFCNVATGKPEPVDVNEPERLANAVKYLKLDHIVITSVDRDDLADGGASQFTNCIIAIRKIEKELSRKTTIEILTPDFRTKGDVWKSIVQAQPDVFNHNIETVPSLYRKVRPAARYFHSLNLLFSVKQFNVKMFTKSGIMLGLGETEDEVLQVMDDMRAANVDFITIGQYLRPTKNHITMERFVTPEEFAYYERIAKVKGFSMVSSSPFTRSSYHAGADFTALQNARNEQ